MKPNLPKINGESLQLHCQTQQSSDDIQGNQDSVFSCSEMSLTALKPCCLFSYFQHCSPPKFRFLVVTLYGISVVIRFGWLTCIRVYRAIKKKYYFLISAPKIKTIFFLLNWIWDAVFRGWIAHISLYRWNRQLSWEWWKLLCLFEYLSLIRW